VPGTWGRTSRERHPEILGRKRVTARFRDRLAEDACNRPFSDVAAAERVSWWRVADAFDAAATRHDPFTGPPPKVLSIDESPFPVAEPHVTLSCPLPGSVGSWSWSRAAAGTRLNGSWA